MRKALTDATAQPLLRVIETQSTVKFAVATLGARIIGQFDNIDIVNLLTVVVVPCFP